MESSLSLKKVFIVTFLAVSLWAMPEAKSELVLEQPVAAIPAPVQARDQDREMTRQTLQVSEKASATVQPVNQAPTLVVPAAPNAPSAGMPGAEDAANSTEVKNLSKSELLRRERVREELKNEDLLQERLEELRLKDEQKRTDTIFGQSNKESPAAAAIPNPGAEPETVIIGNPDQRQRPGSRLSTQDQVVVTQAAPEAAAGAENQASEKTEKKEEHTKIIVSPRGGIANMKNSDGYTIDGKFALGVGVGFAVNDNLVVEGGYTYSEYGVSIISSNPFVQTLQVYNNYNNPNYQTISFKQNTFDVDMKFLLMDSDSKLRPFVLGGGAYSFGYINYDQQLRNMARNVGADLGPDYEVSSYYGVLGTGLDVKISKSFTLGAAFKYYALLSSTQNQSLNNSVFLGNPGGYWGNPAIQDKQAVGGSVANSSYYTIMGNVSFAF